MDTGTSLPTPTNAPPIDTRPATAAEYPWLGEDAPAAVDTLAARFREPPGYRRVGVVEGSFSAWIRRLPLAAPGTPILDYKGKPVRAEDDYTAAVVAIDVGKTDLQNGADFLIRLHAEWGWSRGVEEHAYRAVTDLKLDSKRWFQGLEPKPVGAMVGWVPSKPQRPRTHKVFREYLDAVFLWANNNSLLKDSEPVAAADVRPGDFFVREGKEGDALLVLDVAEAGAGPTLRRVALLGQVSTTMASSPVVLQLGKGSPWFSLRAEANIVTAFAPPYEWSMLRRLPATAAGTPAASSAPAPTASAPPAPSVAASPRAASSH